MKGILNPLSCSHSGDQRLDWKDGKGIPILIRHYLKLNAAFMAFNADKKFSSVIDGLIRVDLRETGPKLLRRFMGKKGMEHICSQIIPSH